MNNTRTIILTIGILICGLVFGGCQTVQKKSVPDGFAAYTETGETYKFRAVSPEGVMYSVRSEKNDPQAELSFWKMALKKHLLDSGYHFIRESGIQAGDEEGYLLEVSAPVDNQNYVYASAIFVRKEEIIIVETAGEVLAYETCRSAVLDAMSKLNEGKK